MTALQNRKVSMGRHPLLKNGSSYYEIYNVLRANPGLTAQQITWRVKGNHETVRRAIRRLKAEGLVAENGKVAMVNRPCLVAVTENMSGFARDKLDVEITVYVNAYGEYSIKAALKGQLATAVEDNPKPVHTQTYKMAIPKPSESFSTRQIFSDDYSPSAKVTRNKDIVIDGEIVDIKDK